MSSHSARIPHDRTKSLSAVADALRLIAATFDSFNANNRLLHAMQIDPYVNGYVCERIQRICEWTAANEQVDVGDEAIYDIVVPLYFGSAARTVSTTEELFRERGGETTQLWQEGKEDALTISLMFVSRADVRSHPFFADALRYAQAHFAGAPDPGSTAGHAEVITALEKVTLGAYLDLAHPVAT
jgi:hypothetical protein